MEAHSLLAEGLELLLVGMGTVFTFLTVLVFATAGMSRIVGRLVPEAPPQPATRGGVGPALDAREQDRVVAAITAAIAVHRARGRDE